MIKIISTYILLLVAGLLHAQYVPRNIAWEKNDGDKKTAQSMETVVPTPDSCYIIAGYVEVKEIQESKFWKIDRHGYILWERQLNEGNKNFIKAVVNTQNDSYLAVGGFARVVNTVEKLDAFVIEIGKEGESMNRKIFGGTENDVFSSLLMLDDGGFIAVGFSDSKGNGKKDVWIARFDKDMVMSWEKYYGGKKDDAAKAITSVPDGTFIVSGYTESIGNGGSDMWFLKIDANGNILRDVTYGKAEDEVCNNLINTADGGYAALGYSVQPFKESVGELAREVLTLKMDKNFNVQWGDKRFFGGAGDDEGYNLINTADRGYTVCAYSSSSKGNGKNDFWVLRLGEFGNQEWEAYFGGKKDDRALAMSATFDGGYIAVGYTESKGDSKRDAWFLKLEDDELVDAGKTVEFSSSLLKPKEFASTATSQTKFIKFDYRTAFIDYFPEIEAYVNKKMETWMVQGVYENADAYSKRMSLMSAIKQEEIFTQEAINQHAPKQIQLNGGTVKISGAYNPEKETFILKIPNTQDIEINVPVANGEAEEFERNWTTYEFQDVRFGLYNKRFVIANASIILNGKLYAFDARKTTEYGKEMQLTVNSYDEKQLKVSAVFSEVVKSVRDSIKNWEKQLEFETQTDYATRTSEENRKIAEEQFSQSALSIYAPQRLKINNLQCGTFDTEHLYFPVEIPNSEYFAVPVKQDSVGDKFATAKFVKENWDTYQLKNIKYGIYDYNYVIYEADITIADSLTFHYFAPNVVEYGKQIQPFIRLADVDYGMLDAYTYKSLFPNEQARGEPPVLIFNNVAFKDFDGNNQIDANENTKITFTLINTGKGKAYRLNCKLFEMNGISGLELEKSKALGDLEGGAKIEVELIVKGKMELDAGKAQFKIRVTEGNRNNPDDKDISLVTNRFVEPKLAVTQSEFTSETGGKIEFGKTVYLKMRVKNSGKGTAQNVTVKFINPDSRILSVRTEIEVGALVADEEKQISYPFIPSEGYTSKEIQIQAIISEQFGKYGDAQTFTVKMDESLMPYTAYDIASDVDFNIPKSDSIRNNRFAIIFGNEDYTKYQAKLGSESNVDFAVADAVTFRKYAENIFGIPAENIGFMVNARKHEMTKIITEIVTLARNAPGGNAEIVFFYAGHGFPDEKTQEPYIMPVDISGADVVNGIKLSKLYTDLVASPNIKRVTVFIDACFSGGGRELGLLAARAVKIKPKETELLKGNLVVFAASSGDQTALPYAEMNHGMFTYALLSQLKTTKGDIKYEFLDEGIRAFVVNYSQRINNKEQNTEINVSTDAQPIWKEWKVR